MKQKMIVMIVLVVLVTHLTGGLVLASAENETSSSLPNKPQATVSTDNPIIDNLMEAIAGLIETIRAYTDQAQEAVRDIISREEEEPEPVEEPTPLPEDEVPATGIVEGRLVDDEKDPLSRMRVIMGARETITDRNEFFFFEDADFGSHELYLSDPNLIHSIRKEKSLIYYNILAQNIFFFQPGYLFKKRIYLYKNVVYCIIVFVHHQLMIGKGVGQVLCQQTVFFFPVFYAFPSPRSVGGRPRRSFRPF